MRVSDRMMFNQANAGVAAARERYQTASTQLTSGTKVAHPADNPAAAALIASYRLSQERLQAIAEVSNKASDELGSADMALDGLTQILTRANELAVQMSNDSYSAADRAGAAKEVDALFHSAITLLNTRVGDRYIFGGNKDSTPPFDSSTGAYSGDAAVRQVEIAQGVLQSASVRADVMMGVAGGGTDVLGALSQLATALTTNDPASVRTSIEELTAGISQVAFARADAGAAQNVLDGAAMLSRVARDKDAETLSHLADADPFQAASELALAEQGLNASLTGAARAFRLSLLDML